MICEVCTKEHTNRRFCSRKCAQRILEFRSGKENPGFGQNQTGDKNNNWRGGSYTSLHSFLNSKLGKASRCVGKKCKKISKTFDWALIKGKEYEWKPENFIELCRSCHGIYDYTEERKQKISKRRKGKKHTKESLEKMSRIAKEKGFGKWCKGKKLNLTPEQRKNRSDKMKLIHLNRKLYGKSGSNN